MDSSQSRENPKQKIIIELQFIGMKKILIPTDFTVQAEFSFTLAKQLTEIVPMEIHFLHVMSIPETVTVNAQNEFETCGEIDESYLKKNRSIALQKLEELKQRVGNQTHVHLSYGKVTDGIIDFAEKGHFSLIAMGTKGSWGLEEKLSGSETQMVARRSSIPVLSLMCDRSDWQPRKIALVNDFKDTANQELEILHEINKNSKTEIHFLQIIGHDTNIDEVKEHMQLFAQNNNITSFQMATIFAKDVEQGVIHFNQMNEIDLLCIGTHGKGGIFHKSATEKLINHMFKPIISFHLRSN